MKQRRDLNQYVNVQYFCPKSCVLRSTYLINQMIKQPHIKSCHNSLLSSSKQHRSKLSYITTVSCGSRFCKSYSCMWSPLNINILIGLYKQPSSTDKNNLISTNNKLLDLPSDYMDVHALISEIFYVHEFADKNLIEIKSRSNRY